MSISNVSVWQITLLGNLGDLESPLNMTIAYDEKSFYETTIKRLRELVMEHGIPGDIRFIFKGKQLVRNEWTLGNYGITRNSVIQCVLRTPGGGTGNYYNSSTHTFYMHTFYDIMMYASKIYVREV